MSLPIMTSDWLFCLGIFLVRCGLIGCPVFVFFVYPPLLALHLFGFFTKVFSFFFNFTSLLFCVFPCFLLLFLPFLLSALLDFVTFCSKSLTFFLFFSGQNCPRFLFQLYTKQNPNQTMHSPNRLNPSPSNVDLCIQML